MPKGISHLFHLLLCIDWLEWGQAPFLRFLQYEFLCKVSAQSHSRMKQVAMEHSTEANSWSRTGYHWDSKRRDEIPQKCFLLAGQGRGLFSMSEGEAKRFQTAISCPLSFCSSSIVFPLPGEAWPADQSRQLGYKTLGFGRGCL